MLIDTFSSPQLGDALGGEGGLGSTPAQADFDFGDRFWYFFIPSSLTSAIVDIKLTSNVDILGQWTFRVDLAEIVQPHSTLLQYA